VLEQGAGARQRLRRWHWRLHLGRVSVARCARAGWNRRWFVIVGLLAALSVKEADDDEPDDCVSPREADCVSSRL
jgi:hypothetical protein